MFSQDYASVLLVMASRRGMTEKQSLEARQGLRKYHSDDSNSDYEPQNFSDSSDLVNSIVGDKEWK